MDTPGSIYIYEIILVTTDVRICQRYIVKSEQNNYKLEEKFDWNYGMIKIVTFIAIALMFRRSAEATVKLYALIVLYDSRGTA